MKGLLSPDHSLYRKPPPMRREWKPMTPAAFWIFIAGAAVSIGGLIALALVTILFAR